MNPEIDVIKNLYQSEIDAYKKQVEDLKAINDSANEKNSALLDKVQQLTEIIEQAKSTNDDLVSAFDHIREQNLRLQTCRSPEQPVEAPTRSHNMDLDSLQAQNFESVLDKITWMSAKDKLYQKIKFLERECGRYARDNNTLSKQVRHLIKALEEERGMIIRRSSDTKNQREIVNSTDVIDEHLVTFESIEELQRQNQRLLSLVKELSRKEEERETRLENEDIVRLNSDIKDLKSQLDSVRSDRERLLDSFNTIIKERDLFKILLTKTRQAEHLTAEAFQRMVSIACSAGPAITNNPAGEPDQTERINDLKNVIDKFERENNKLRDEMLTKENQAKDEIKIKTDSLIEIKVEFSKLEQLNEQLTQRNQVLESNLKSLESEFDEFRTKSQKLAFEVEKSNEESKRLSKENQDLLKANRELDDKNNELANQNQELIEKVNELHEDLSIKEEQAKEEIRIKTETLEEFEAQYNELEQLNEQLNERNQEFEDRNNVLTKSNQDLMEQLQKLREEISAKENQAKDEIKIKTDSLIEIKVEFTKLEQLNEQLTQRNQVLESNLKSLESEFDEFRTESQKLAFEVEKSNEESKRLPKENQDILQADRELDDKNTELANQNQELEEKVNMELDDKNNELAIQNQELREEVNELHEDLSIREEPIQNDQSEATLQNQGPTNEEGTGIVLKRRKLDQDSQLNQQ